MATKFFLTDDTSPVTIPSMTTKVLSLTAGSGLATSVTNSAASSPLGATDTAGGTLIGWLSNPLDAVTIASTITNNTWALESGMNANFGAAMYIFQASSSGTLLQPGGQIILSITDGTGYSKGVEYGTTVAVQNWTSTPRSTEITAGNRIAILPKHAQVGTGAAGFTLTINYAGTSAGANGDSWVQFTETITEQTVAGGDVVAAYVGGGYYP